MATSHNLLVRGLRGPFVFPIIAYGHPWPSDKGTKITKVLLLCIRRKQTDTVWALTT